MKRIVTFAAGALALAVAAVPAFAQTAAAPAASQAASGSKIGVIEVQRIVQESAIGKESLARVQKLQQSKQEELTRRQKELRDLETKIQDQGKALSEDAMEKLQKEYQAKAVELKRFQDDAQKELEETQRKELGDLEKRIMPVITEVAREQGYQLVFNKFNSGLLFADDKSVDLTDAVITKFNSQIAAPKAATAKPAAAAPAPAAAKPAAPAAAKPAAPAAPKK
ncbi:MAG TPA: OmpH family outer membrane protein [Thermoanaerobaculia bacterium]|jgi:outer membrane protein